MRARDQTRLVHSVRANMAPEKGSADTKETDISSRGEVEVAYLGHFFCHGSFGIILYCDPPIKLFQPVQRGVRRISNDISGMRERIPGRVTWLFVKSKKFYLGRIVKVASGESAVRFFIIQSDK